MTAEIGVRLRAARRARGISLRKLADEIGVSASLISQVENGKTRPSVQTLYALVNQLGLSMDELVGGPTVINSTVRSPDRVASRPGSTFPTVQYPGDNPTIEMENGVTWERLAVGEDGAADALLVTYAPGASSSVEGRLMRHNGVEYAYILEGQLTLQLEFETYDLVAGCSLQFSSIRPHLYTNRGSTVARGIWFVFGRREQTEAMPSPELASPRHRTNPASFIDVLRVMDERA